MRLVTYRLDVCCAARLGAQAAGEIVDLELLAARDGKSLPSSMQGLIDMGPRGLAAARALLEKFAGRWPEGTAWPQQNARLLAPLPRPRKNIFGIGLNYIEHVEESSRTLDTSKDLPKQPVIFSKPPTSVIGPGEAIEHNGAITQQLDWEVELAVVMGKRAKRVPRSEALDHVFGYSVIIDISARDCRRAGQWIYSKGQDTYAPFGPCIVTTDEIADPQTLNLSLNVNGIQKQNSNTRHMLFSVAELIADISAGITLDPGDIIATGTPSGVGASRSPQEWLRPGDVVEASVQNIGMLRHPVVAV